MGQNFGGLAAEQQTTKATPAVRGHADQATIPRFRSLDNRLGRLGIRDMQNLGDHTDLVSSLLRGLQDAICQFLLAFLEPAADLDGRNPCPACGRRIDREGFRHGDDGHLRAEGLGQRQAVVEALGGGFRSIGGNQDVMIHDHSFWLTGKIWRMAGSSHCCTGQTFGQGNPGQINARDDHGAS